MGNHAELVNRRAVQLRGSEHPRRDIPRFRRRADRATRASRDRAAQLPLRLRWLALSVLRACHYTCGAPGASPGLFLDRRATIRPVSFCSQIGTGTLGLAWANRCALSSSRSSTSEAFYFCPLTTGMTF